MQLLACVFELSLSGTAIIVCFNFTYISADFSDEASSAVQCFHICNVSIAFQYSPWTLIIRQSAAPYYLVISRVILQRWTRNHIYEQKISPCLPKFVH